MGEAENDRLVFSPDTFVKMLEFLEQSFGSAGRSMTFQMGNIVGTYEARKIMSGFDGEREPTKRELLEEVLDALASTGVVMRVDEFDAERGVVKIGFPGNVFGPLCTKADLPQCFWLRGFVVGVVAEVTEMRLSFKESDCIGRGDAECSMTLTRAPQAKG